MENGWFWDRVNKEECQTIMKVKNRGYYDLIFTTKLKSRIIRVKFKNCNIHDATIVLKDLQIISRKFASIKSSRT